MAAEVMFKLEMQYNNLTKSQRRVAEYIMQNPMQAAFSTIDKIAHTTDVSTTTVVRLTGALGYSGFAEFQNELKEYLCTKSAPINKFSMSNMQEKGHDKDDDLLEIMQTEIDNIQKTYEGLPESVIQNICMKLVKAGNIYIFGARTCEGAARYMAYDLSRMFLNTQYVSENPCVMPEIFNRLGPEDVVVAIGFSRYVRFIADAAKWAKMQGASVVVITDSYDSPLVPYSDELIVCYGKTKNFHNSIVSVVFIADLIFKGCTKIASKRIEENLEKLEKTLSDLNFMMKK